MLINFFQIKTLCGEILKKWMIHSFIDYDYVYLCKKRWGGGGGSPQLALPLVPTPMSIAVNTCTCHWLFHASVVINQLSQLKTVQDRTCLSLIAKTVPSKVTNISKTSLDLFIIQLHLFDKHKSFEYYQPIISTKAVVAFTEVK